MARIVISRFVKRIETDIAALIPENYRSVRTLRDSEQVVGGVGSWRLRVQSEDYESSKRFVDDLVVELRKSAYAEHVNFVSYQKEVDFYKKNALLYMDIDDLEEILIRIEDRLAQEKFVAGRQGERKGVDLSQVQFD